MFQSISQSVSDRIILECLRALQSVSKLAVAVAGAVAVVVAVAVAVSRSLPSWPGAESSESEGRLEGSVVVVPLSSHGRVLSHLRVKAD